MTTKLQTHENAPWLGSFPNDWTFRRGKFFFRSRKKINSDLGCNNVLSLTMGGVIHREELGEGGLLPASYETFQVFYPNDLVFKLIDLENYKTSRVGLVPERGIMSSAYIRLVPIDESAIYPKFAYYFYYNLYLQGIYNFLGMGVRSTLAPWNLLEIPILLSLLETQKRIAEFLDEKTEIIDELVAKKEKLIEFLREKRAALITRAVTKGLDPNAKLKPSGLSAEASAKAGIDWLGNIPAGWEIISLGKILAYEQPGNYISSAIDAAQYHENMVPVLTANKGFIIGYTDEKDGVFDKDLPVIIFDDFTTSKQFVDFPFKVRSSALKILKIRNKDGNDIRFIFRSMEVLGFHVLEHNRHWIAMYSKVNIAHPSSHIQKQIADFLDAETGRIDKAVALIESQIEKLKEYRSSLIYHAVTGKIKV